MLSNHFIQEQIILPLSDMLTGQSVGKYLRFLQKSRYWSREQIDRFQNERLRLLIAHAYENVPFYREEMDKLQLTPTDIRTKEDLHLLPIVTKAMIKKEGLERFKATNIPEKSIIKGASSGSTGEPFHYLTTKEDYSVNIAANLRGWYDMGWRLGDKYIKLSQNPRKNPIKRLQDYVTNNLYLATNPLTDENFACILQQIESYKPLIIRCYPDPLLLLARYKHLHPEFTWSPMAITTTGNTLFPEIRKEIEEAWGCKIFDSYSSEGNSCVFECFTHTCYHSTEEYGISEVLDEQGNPIKKGVGRLISTSLWNMVHPFIRYDTQDFVEVDNTPCECGREHLKILRILGRDNDVLVMPSGRRFIVHNFTVFFQMSTAELKKSVDQFQVIRKKNGNVVFRLVVNKNYDVEVRDYIIHFWQQEFGVPVTIELLREIPIMHNNKRHFIINE